MNDTDTCKAKIRELAARLHSERQMALSGKADESLLRLLEKQTCEIPGVKLEGNTIVFQDLAVRNQLAADHFFETNKALLFEENKLWLDIALAIFRNEIGAPDSATGRLIAQMNLQTDVLQRSANIITQQNVFDVLLVIGAAIPHLASISLQSLYNLCAAQEQYTKRDYMYGHFFQQLSKGIEHRPELCIEMMNRLRNDISETNANLYLTAASALKQTNASAAAEIVIADSSASDHILVSASIQMMGNLIHSDGVSPEATDEMVKGMRNLFKSNIPLLQNASMISILSSCQRTSEFDDELIEMTNNGSQPAGVYLARLFAQAWRDETRRPKLPIVVPRLCLNLAEHQSEVLYLDALLSDLLVQDEFQNVVLSGLQAWLLQSKEAKSSALVTHFSSTISKLCSQPAMLSRICTQWLLHPEPRIPAAVEHLLTFAIHNTPNGQLPIIFDQALLDKMELGDFELLSYRCLAYISDAFVQVSLIASLFNAHNLTPIHYQIIQQALLHYLAADYPGIVVSGLQGILASDPETNVLELCTEIINTLQANAKVLRDLPARKEIIPSTSLALAFQQLSNRRFNSAFKKSESQSALLKLVTRVPVKAGAKVMYFGHSAQDCAGSTLNDVEVNQFIPRRLIVDPLGFEMEKLTFKLLQRVTS